MADEIRKELDALKNDIAQLRKDIAGLTSAVKDVASEKVDATTSQAREKVGSAWEDIERKLNEVLGQGRETVRTVEQKIGEHPGGSILAAFGIGFLVAKLLDIRGRN